MKLFLSKLLLYFLLTFIFLLVLDFFVFPQNTNVMSVKNDLLKNENTEILVLGNSHTFFGINPDFIKRTTINVANKSRKLEVDYFILRKNIKDLKKLRLVVLPISSYTLFTEKVSKKEKRLYYNFYKLKEYDQGLYYNSLVFHESFKELIENALFKTTNVSKSGWIANSEVYKFDKEIINTRIGNVNESLSRKSTIKLNLNYLKQVIDLCEIYNVKLMLLLPPYHPDFYLFTNNEYDKEIKKYLKTIDLKSSKLFDSKSFNITEDIYFENVDHLNRKGAEIFSKKLAKDINQLFINE